MTIDETRQATELPRPERVGSLSRRETAVLCELVQGFTLEQIARRLFVSRNTVKTQVASLYRKLGVTTRAEAIERGGELLRRS
nr:LuxR C-terminal-related transcriptional regulator [Paraoerskovia marina]